MAARNTHQSLERRLRILEALAELHGPIALHEIAQRTSLSRSTARHLLKALVDFGYLFQDKKTRTYLLSPKLFRLTRRTWTKEQLAEIAAPFLDQLSRKTGEGTCLAILQDGVVIIIAKRKPDGLVRVVQEVGAQRPIHCSAVGKCLAAWLEDKELNSILSRTVLERKFPRQSLLRESYARS